MPSNAESEIPSKLEEAIDLLERLRSARTLPQKEKYEALALEIFGVARAKQLIKGVVSDQKECTCILRHEDEERKYVGVTQPECAATATEYGLEWEWVCD
jgi:hypothetical protein